MHALKKVYKRKKIIQECPLCSKEFKCEPRELKRKRKFPRTCSLSCALKLANKIRGYGPQKFRINYNGLDKRQVKVNSENFNKENELFAYFLGLIATDGHISKNGNIIGLSSIDKELIDIFIEYCKENINNIYSKSPRIDNRNKKPVLKIEICCPELKTKLIERGITPQKSKTIKSVKVCDSLFRHFLRGVIDGDGSWSIDKTNNRIVFCICSGSNEFLNFIRGKLETLDFKTVKIRWGNGSRVYFLSISTKEYIKLILLLYQDAKYFLTRKRDRAMLAYKKYAKKDF